MPLLILLSKDMPKAKEMSRILLGHGYTCSIIGSVSGSDDGAWNNVKLVIADLSNVAGSEKQSLVKDINFIKHDRHLSVIIIIPQKMAADSGLIQKMDDFILAPVNMDELVLRVKKALAFRKKASSSEDIMNFGDIVIDTAQAEVTVDGNAVPLTFKEYELLRFLARNKGRVYSREALLNEVWGFDYFGGDRTVDVHIRRLRGKIEATGHTFIDTVRNMGYKFITGS